MKIIFKNTISNNQNFYDLCEKHFEKLVVLFNEEVFEIKRGNAVLHFDGNGNLKMVDKAYRKEVGA